MEQDLISGTYPYLIFPILCIIAVLTNSLNVTVFINPKMKDTSFKYLLCISISEVVYAGISTFIFVTFCDDCQINRYYSVQVYIIYQALIVRTLALFCIFCDTVLSIERYMILKNKKFLKPHWHKYVIFSLLVISFLFYFPLHFSKEIIPIYYNNNTTNMTIIDNNSYKLVSTEFGKSIIGKILLINASVFRLFFGSILLTIINVMNLYEFKKRYQNRQSAAIRYTVNNNLNQTNRNLEASKNITLMVIWSSILFIFGNTPVIIINILQFILDPNSFQLVLAFRISLALIYFTHSLNFVIYILFNKLFRKILFSYFQKIKFNIFKC
jgi:hypothetical protein